MEYQVDCSQDCGKGAILAGAIVRISEPTLEFKGSVWHVQKRHPTLVAYVDLILQPRCKFKVSVAVSLNRLSSLQTSLWYNSLVYSFLFPLAVFWEYLTMIETEL